MTYTNRLKVAAILALSSLTLTTAILPAQAGQVIINARQTGGQSIKLAFAVTCIESNNSESKAGYYSVWTGDYVDVDGCERYAIYFRSNGRSYDYELSSGKSYTFEWTGNHWNLFDE